VINPNQFPTRLDVTKVEQKAIEDHIDRHLQANRRNEWPLTIPSARCTWRPENLQVVLDKYKLIGWRVIIPFTGDLAIFDLPKDH